MQNQLIPSNWQLANLGDISSDISYGYTASATSEPTGVKLLRITDIQNNTVNWPNVPNCKIEPEKVGKYRLKQRDLVFARTGATVGKSYLLKGEIPESVYASYLIRVRCLEGISIEFLSSYFQSPYYWRQITDFSAGIGQPNVNGTKLKNLSVPLPPLAEQKVIADKLDTLLAQVENTRARLERIPQILKRFRQSVLAAAVSGRLTEEWRKAVARSEWSDNRLDDVCHSVSDGDHQAPPRAQSGIPFLVISNVTGGEINFDEVSRWVPEAYYNSLKSIRKPQRGDLLYTVTGSFGIPVIVNTDKPFCFQRHIAIIKPNHDMVSARYLAVYLQSPKAFAHAADVATGTAQKTVSLNNLRKFSIRLPTMDEQTKIVRRVDQLFAHADSIEQQVNNALARVNNLTQSILAKAFRGELTEQWRKDNPELISGENSAEALLERIKAERAAMKPVKRTRNKRTTV